MLALLVITALLLLSVMDGEVRLPRAVNDVPVQAVGDESLSPVQALAQIEAEVRQVGWTDDLHTQAGALYDRMGNSAAAAAAWEQVANADAAVTRRLADAYLTLEAWPDAVDALRQLLDFEPQDSWAHYQLGLILAAVDPYAAQEHLTAALNVPAYAATGSRLLATLHDHAGEPLVSMEVALTLFEARHWSHAAVAFEQAALLRDPYPEALAYLGLTRSRQGKAGAEYLAAAADSAPDNAYVWYANGIYLRDQRQFDASLDALARAVDAAPDNPYFMAEMSMAYRLLGDVQAAEYWLRTAVNTSGNAPEFQQMLVLFYAEEGYTLNDEGLRLLSEASQSLPDDPDVRASHGWALYTTGRTDAALDEIRAALALDETNARALYYRGRIALEEGDLALAQSSLEHVAASISPYAVEALAYLQQIEQLAHTAPEITPELTPDVPADQ